MSEVTPILLSAIICDRVIFDRLTGMPSVINIIQAVNSPRFPIRHDQIIFFCEMTNGHGKSNVKIALVDTEQQDKVLFEQRGSVEFKDVRQIVTLAVSLRGVVFEKPGDYSFQIFAESNLLGERRIQCRQVSPPPQRPEPPPGQP